LRLAGTVLVEQHDEWEAGERRHFSESSMLELKSMVDPAMVLEKVNILPELIAA
jgi:putative transposase